MGFKVFDYACEECEHRSFDELVFCNEAGELAEGEMKCPVCGVHMTRLMPAPAGYVYDAGQIASKGAIARAFKLQAKAASMRPGSVEKKEMEAEAKTFLTPGVT